MIGVCDKDHATDGILYSIPDRTHADETKDELNVSPAREKLGVWPFPVSS